MAWQTPKTDWAVNPKNPVPEDFNRIEGNIAFLKGDIETKKGAIVNALNTVGLETELTDTHAQIANKIVAANQGTKIYTPSTVNQPIPKGFHSGQGYVKGDANLKPENIIAGKSIFGVNGTAIEGKRWASGQTSTAVSQFTVNNLTFRPSRVIIRGKTATYNAQFIFAMITDDDNYFCRHRVRDEYFPIIKHLGDDEMRDIDFETPSDTDGRITDTGFISGKLTVMDYPVILAWEAYE